MASEYTPNYNLDLYVSTDKPNLRDQYNAAMGKIDTEIKNTNDSIVSANNNISTLQTTVGQHTTKIGELETTVGQHTTKIGELETTVEENTSDVSTLKTTVGQHTTQISNLTENVTQQGASISELQTNVSSNTSSISSLQTGKAPTNHAAAATTYGAGTSTLYGHVKVSDSGSDTHIDGMAASTNAVQKIIDYFNFGQPVQHGGDSFTASDVYYLNPDTLQVTQAANPNATSYNWDVYSQLNKAKTAGKIYAHIYMAVAAGYAPPSGQKLVVKLPSDLTVNVSENRTIHLTGLCSNLVVEQATRSNSQVDMFIINGSVYMEISPFSQKCSLFNANHWQSIYYFEDFSW